MIGKRLSTLCSASPLLFFSLSFPFPCSPSFDNIAKISSRFGKSGPLTPRQVSLFFFSFLPFPLAPFDRLKTTEQSSLCLLAARSKYTNLRHPHPLPLLLLLLHQILKSLPLANHSRSLLQTLAQIQNSVVVR